jgi:hypothetical protein
MHGATVKIDVFIGTLAQNYYNQLVVVVLHFIVTTYQNYWSILVARTVL